MTARHRRGFTLIEVLASLAIALLLIVPIARIIAGAAGTFAGLERSVERRVNMQAATALAMTIDPLRPGRREIGRSEEHTSELQSRENLVCRLLLEKKKSEV